MTATLNHSAMYPTTVIAPKSAYTALRSNRFKVTWMVGRGCRIHVNDPVEHAAAMAVVESEARRTHQV